MRLHVHSTAGGLKPDVLPHRALTITEGLLALVVLVALVGGGAAVLTWGILATIHKVFG